jgi:hypothetical protein
MDCMVWYRKQEVYLVYLVYDFQSPYIICHVSSPDTFPT